MLERSQGLQPRMLLYSGRGHGSQLLLPAAKALSRTGQDGMGALMFLCFLPLCCSSSSQDGFASGPHQAAVGQWH